MDRRPIPEGGAERKPDGPSGAAENLSALKASELRYRRLFETAQDGILILDAETGMIVDANFFLVDMLGFSHNEFLQKYIWEIGALKSIAEN